jgi:hypothetical protein
MSLTVKMKVYVSKESSDMHSNLNHIATYFPVMSGSLGGYADGTVCDVHYYEQRVESS